MRGFDEVVSLSSLCVIYPRGRPVRKKAKKGFQSFFTLWKFSLRQISVVFTAANGE
jgi:hypothetical protein